MLTTRQPGLTAGFQQRFMQINRINSHMLRHRGPHAGWPAPSGHTNGPLPLLPLQVWDPALIIAQIVSVQCLFYISLGLIQAVTIGTAMQQAAGGAATHCLERAQHLLLTPTCLLPPPLLPQAPRWATSPSPTSLTGAPCTSAASWACSTGSVTWSMPWQEQQHWPGW